MDQQIFNWALAALSGLLGFLLNSVWQAVKDLQSADKELAKKVGEIEVLVAGSYVTWDGLKDALNPVMAQLTRIEDKLDKKQDK